MLTQACLDIIFYYAGGLANNVGGFIAQVDLAIASLRDNFYNLQRIDVDGAARLIACYLIEIHCHTVDLCQS